ncbi:MAG TPA: LysM peptidoglycan-binding domain-containing protein [bacterium]|nr:LysM peptidoglycan-binding domain-containing protein [bacterium]HOL35259.1 LysM peptidoglycan-binding domain-containing protein [bacterium]HPP08718.1 LysM peptidoglycan-binding domain-containing protein [bacterium]
MKWLIITFGFAALTGCIQIADRNIEKEMTSRATNSSPVAVPVSGNSMDKTAQSNSDEEKISLLSLRIQELQSKIEKLENRLNDLEPSINQVLERATSQLSSSMSEVNTKLYQISEIQNKSTAISNELINSFQSLNQNFLTLQKNFLELQKSQNIFQNELEKSFVDARMLAIKDVEKITSDKMKIFVEELTKQAENLAKQQARVSAIEKKIGDIEVHLKEVEKNSSEIIDKRIGVVLDEIAKHESKIVSIDRKIDTKDIQLAQRFDAGIEKTLGAIDNQLKQKFSIIISELVKHESGIYNLDNRLKSIEGIVNVSGLPSEYASAVESAITEERKKIEQRYMRELEDRMQFYSRMKNLLEDIAKKESQLALYRAQIASLESVKVDTQVVPVYRYIIVKPGDTLSKIAVRYRTSISYLKQINGLISDMIYAGQYLKVPLK